jgi:hypothetical protein
MFFKDSKIVIMMENDHQHDAEEEKEKKVQVKFTASWFVHQNLGNVNKN